MSYPATTDLTADDVRANAGTIANVRLWEPRPALDTYGQIQEIRLHYSFVDVDVDRYLINGEYRQVLISGRELDQTQLPEQSQTWVNKHLTYTHGYGAVVSPVNEAGGTEGFIPVTPCKDHATDKVQKIAKYISKPTDAHVVLSLEKYMHKADITLNTNGLLIRGAESDLLSHETAVAMTQRGPKPRLVELPGIGHAQTLVADDQVRLVRDFLLAP